MEDKKLEDMSAAELRAKADEFLKHAETKTKGEIDKLISTFKTDMEKIRDRLDSEWKAASDDLKQAISTHISDLPNLSHFTFPEPKQKATPTKRDRAFLYWNPENHRASWDGIKEPKPKWYVDDMDSKPEYIHRQNPRYEELVQKK